MYDNSLDNYHVGQDDIQLHKMEQKQQKEKEKNLVVCSIWNEPDWFDNIESCCRFYRKSFFE